MISVGATLVVAVGNDCLWAGTRPAPTVALNLNMSEKRYAIRSAIGFLGFSQTFCKGEIAMKIRPTLYVGLGTTGMTILNHLRVLNHNEYGSAEYPIFRYVSIETDTSNNGTVSEVDGNLAYMSYDDRGVPTIYDNQPRPESAGNKVIHTIIPATEPIRNKIDSSHSSYNKHLYEWLYPGILDLDATTRAGGAGNLRMVGRLSLWENWDKQSRVQQCNYPQNLGS